MSELPYAKELQFAQRQALEAGTVMLSYFDDDQGIEIKADGSPVTVADTTVNQNVLNAVEQEYPDDSLIGEELSSEITNRPRRWILDPIDGTKSFTHGLTLARFSLGLTKQELAYLGVAYDPFTQRMYSGVSDQGSFRNGRRLQVSNHGLRGGLVSVTGNPANVIGSQFVRRLLDEKADVLPIDGAVAKSLLVAEGKSVGYVGPSVKPHDMAAVDVIVREAGGMVTDLDGNRLNYELGFKGAVVSNGVVHEQLLDMYHAGV
jgi:fructose-1,6-bisphosphatase/inositol monophosphatase family enzyme